MTLTNKGPKVKVILSTDPRWVDHVALYSGKLRRLEGYTLPERLTVNSTNDFLAKTGAGFTVAKSADGKGVDMIVKGQKTQHTQFKSFREFMKFLIGL